MDDELLNSFKIQLEQRKQELIEADSISADGAKTVELDQTRQGRLSRMDALQGQAMSIAAKNRRNQELQPIKAALERIELGDYGYCEECGKEIAVSRLQINLTAEYCIDCANKLEN